MFVKYMIVEDFSTDSNVFDMHNIRGFYEPFERLQFV